MVAQATTSDAPPSNPETSIPLHAWRVVAVEGVAHMLADTGRSIGWTALQAGQQLPPNVQIETGSQSQVLLFNGSDAITVYADTRIGLPEIEADTTAVNVHQNRGRADYHVRDRESGFSLEDLFIGVGRLLGADKDEPERFRVFAPRLTTVVKGTVFTVTVLRDQTNVMVSDGVVEVVDPRSGNDAEVSAGQIATARPDVAAGVSLRGGIPTLFDPSNKVPSLGLSGRRTGPRNDRDETGSEAGIPSTGGGADTAGETAASTGGEGAGASAGGDTYSIAGGPEEGDSAGGVGAAASGESTGGSVESASSAGAAASGGGTGAASAAGGGAEAASVASGGSADGVGGEVAASESGSGTGEAASSASSSSGSRWSGGGSITISGTGERGTASVTISRDGITVTRDESATGERSLTISGSGERGSFSTTYSDEGVERTVSGPDGGAGDAGAAAGTQ